MLFLTMAIPAVAFSALLYFFFPSLTIFRRRRPLPNEAWRKAVLYPRGGFAYLNRYQVNLPYSGDRELTFHARHKIFQSGLKTSLTRSWNPFARACTLSAEEKACLLAATAALGSVGWTTLRLRKGRLIADWVGVGAYDWRFRVDPVVSAATLDQAQLVLQQLAYQLGELAAGRTPIEAAILPDLVRRETPPLSTMGALLLWLGLTAGMIALVLLGLLFLHRQDFFDLQAEHKTKRQLAMLERAQAGVLWNFDAELRPSFSAEYPVTLLVPQRGAVATPWKVQCPGSVCEEALRLHAGKKVRAGLAREREDAPPILFRLDLLTDSGAVPLITLEEAMAAYRSDRPR